MKTIGIKLADGTFYPVLEEGIPKKRMLDLTTAKDNQTKVQIDLYRSETGTMDDAEYVDTLEVTKLNPHPNGEPELHLSVGLDEENHLTAEVVDPETGKKSETEVTLVSRTKAQLDEPNDFGVVDANVSEETLAETPTEATFSPEELPDIKSDALEDMPFSFEHAEPNAAGTSASVATGIASESSGFADIEENLPVEDKTLESVDFSSDKTQADDNDATIVDDDATISDESISSDDLAGDDFSLPDFDSDDNTFAADLPDFDSFGTDSDSGDDTTLVSTDSFADSSLDSSIDSSTDSSDDEPDLSGFDLPDFDNLDSDTNSDSAGIADTSPTGINFDDLDDPAFSSKSSGSAMDFSDLYDKETIAGEHASIYDESDEVKKTRKPVIICIICAIICVIATILVLFIVPSKYNLLPSRNTNGVSILDNIFSKEEKTDSAPTKQEYKTEETAPKEEPTIVIDVKSEPKPKEEAPSAVEDKIVIAPEPEKVVPVPPPAPKEEKKHEKSKRTSDVKYHIKWGDTLWDISESYYKTPWKYQKIANYNGIKNPDFIVSGKDILLPAD